MAKGFKDAAENQSPVYSTIIGSSHDELYAQEEPSAQEVYKAQEELRTQGRRGVKAQRINMAFTPSNLDYMRVMAGLKGISMTQLVNDIIAREREQNKEAYETAKRLSESL
jgi:ribosomal protein L20